MDTLQTSRRGFLKSGTGAALSIGFALPLAGFLVRPLRPVFEVKVGKSNKDYVGSTCTITTGHVDNGCDARLVDPAGGQFRRGRPVGAPGLEHQGVGPYR